MPGNVQPRRVVLAAHDSLAVAGDVHVRARERARAEVDVGSVGGSEGLGRSPVGADLVQRRARGHVDASPRIEGDPVGAGRGQRGEDLARALHAVLHREPEHLRPRPRHDVEAAVGREREPIRLGQGRHGEPRLAALRRHPVEVAFGLVAVVHGPAGAEGHAVDALLGLHERPHRRRLTERHGEHLLPRAAFRVENAARRVERQTQRVATEVQPEGLRPVVVRRPVPPQEAGILSGERLGEVDRPVGSDHQTFRGPDRLECRARRQSGRAASSACPPIAVATSATPATLQSPFVRKVTPGPRNTES